MTVISPEQIKSLAQLANRQIVRLQEISQPDEKTNNFIEAAIAERRKFIEELQSTNRDISSDTEDSQTRGGDSGTTADLIALDNTLREAIGSGVAAFSTNSRARDILEKYHSLLSRKGLDHLRVLAAAL